MHHALQNAQEDFWPHLISYNAVYDFLHISSFLSEWTSLCFIQPIERRARAHQAWAHSPIRHRHIHRWKTGSGGILKSHDSSNKIFQKFVKQLAKFLWRIMKFVAHISIDIQQVESRIPVSTPLHFPLVYAAESLSIDISYCSEILSCLKSVSILFAIVWALTFAHSIEL